MSRSQRTVAFHLAEKGVRGTMVTALYSSPNQPEGSLSLDHVVGSREEVDVVMAQAAQTGAQVTDPAHDRFWDGYAWRIRRVRVCG